MITPLSSPKISVPEYILVIDVCVPKPICGKLYVLYILLFSIRAFFSHRSDIKVHFSSILYTLLLESLNSSCVCSIPQYLCQKTFVLFTVKHPIAEDIHHKTSLFHTKLILSTIALDHFHHNWLPCAVVVDQSTVPDHHTMAAQEPENFTEYVCV
jgi:hypothetical protein